MSTFPEIGIYNDVDIDVYHADKTCISSSRLKEAMKSLKHFYTYYDEPIESKANHLDFGNAFETCLLDAVNGTNLKDDVMYILDEDERPEPEKNYQVKANKVWREEEYEKAGNRYIVSKTGIESMETIEKMAKSCMDNKLIVALLKNTDYQKTTVWKDSKTGLLLKSRPDTCSVNKNVLVDIKTTLDSSPFGFHRDIRKYHYYLQAIMQIRGVIESGLMPNVKSYYWLAVEKRRPYNAQLYMFDHEDWEYCNILFDYILGKISMAQATNKWTGYEMFSENGRFQGTESQSKYGVIPFKLSEFDKSLF